MASTKVIFLYAECDHNKTKLGEPEPEDSKKPAPKKVGPREGYARKSFPEWLPEARVPHLFDEIRKQTFDILFMKEARRITRDGKIVSDSLSLMKEGIAKLGLQCIDMPYNDDPNFFHYLVGYDNTKFELLSYERIGLAEGLIRGILVCNFRCIATTAVVTLVGVHAGLSRKERFLTSKILTDYTEKKLSGKHFVVLGDFNTFMDDGGAEQLEMMKMHEVQTAAPMTFITYPFDPVGCGLVPAGVEDFDSILTHYEKNSKVFSKLDHAFTSDSFANGSTAEVKWLWSDGVGPASLSEQDIKKYVLDRARNHHTPATWSDHQMILVHVTNDALIDN